MPGLCHQPSGHTTNRFYCRWRLQRGEGKRKACPESGPERSWPLWPIVLSAKDKGPREPFSNVSSSSVDNQSPARAIQTCLREPRSLSDAFLSRACRSRRFFSLTLLLLKFRPPPLFFVAFLFSVQPYQKMFAGLNWETALSSDQSCPPSPVVKHSVPLCSAPYHPDFTRLSLSLFVSRQKKAFAQGREGCSYCFH